MVYGTYSGPNKPDKGKEGGSCMRSRCQAAPATFYNHATMEWYCADCARDIGLDEVNLFFWNRDRKPLCGHPQFETRKQMEGRVRHERVARVLGIAARSDDHDKPHVAISAIAPGVLSRSSPALLGSDFPPHP